MKKFLALLCLLSFVLTWASASPRQQKKEKKSKAQSGSSLQVQLPVADQINHDIGEMLGAWQVGDVQAMQKYYADDATFVAGTFSMPIVGFENYVRQYLQERKGFSGIQLIRRNTNIFHYQNTAWACYQWEFQGLAGGRAVTARGQTTLVFVKKGNRWLIVHNHTSEICPGS